jgi:capsular polysaccharide transport system permease protein
MLHSLGIQRRVLYALLMREVITRFGRENLGVLWLIAEPMLFTLGVTTLWTAAGLHHGSPIPIVAFAVTGYSSVLMWRNSASRAGSAVGQNKALLFHRNVQVIDVLLTRIVLEIGGATLSFIVLSLLFIFVGWMPTPIDLLEVVFGWLMLAWFGASLAFLIGAGTAFSEVVER